RSRMASMPSTTAAAWYTRTLRAIPQVCAWRSTNEEIDSPGMGVWGTSFRRRGDGVADRSAMGLLPRNRWGKFGGLQSFQCQALFAVENSTHCRTGDSLHDVPKTATRTLDEVLERHLITYGRRFTQRQHQLEAADEVGKPLIHRPHRQMERL